MLRRVLSLLLPALLAAGCVAPGPRGLALEGPTGFEASQRTDRVSSADHLAAFAAVGGAASYVLGAGDRLTIEAWGRQALSGTHVIGPDGRITLPLAGDLALAGLPRAEARDVVEAAWQPYFDHLAVTLRVDEYTSHHVLVLGRVANPGAIRFDRPPTLLETIARAGALPVGGLGSEKAALRSASVFRGRHAVATVDLKPLLRGEDLSLNLPLRSGDIVYLPEADDQLVYVLGEVERPGAFNLTPNITILDAIAKAGGPTADADATAIELVRAKDGVALELSLAELRSPDPARLLALEEGDLIYVRRSGIARVGYTLRQLSPLSALFIFAGAGG